MSLSVQGSTAIPSGRIEEDQPLERSNVAHRRPRRSPRAGQLHRRAARPIPHDVIDHRTEWDGITSQGRRQRHHRDRRSDSDLHPPRPVATGGTERARDQPARRGRIRRWPTAPQRLRRRGRRQWIHRRLPPGNIEELGRQTRGKRAGPARSGRHRLHLRAHRQADRRVRHRPPLGVRHRSLQRRAHGPTPRLRPLRQGRGHRTRCRDPRDWNPLFARAPGERDGDPRDGRPARPLRRRRDDRSRRNEHDRVGGVHRRPLAHDQRLHRPGRDAPAPRQRRWHLGDETWSGCATARPPWCSTR